MSGKRKLTDAERDFIIDSVSRRREVERRLRMFPTNAELASEFGVSERRITFLVRKGAKTRVSVSRGTEKDAHASLRGNNPE